MLQNAYFLAKIGADTAENEQHFAEILPKTGNYPTGPGTFPRNGHTRHVCRREAAAASVTGASRYDFPDLADLVGEKDFEATSQLYVITICASESR